MNTQDLEKRLLATTVYQLRVLLGGQIDDIGPVGDAARLAYSLHNYALDALEANPFDVSEALQRLERFEPTLGRKWLNEFARGVRDEVPGEQTSAPPERPQTPGEPPQELRRIVDQLWLFLNGLPDAHEERRAASCVNFMKAVGLTQAFVHAEPDAFRPPYVRGSRMTHHALAGAGVEGRTYVVWADSNACGVNASFSLAPADLADARGRHDLGYMRFESGDEEGSSTRKAPSP